MEILPLGIGTHVPPRSRAHGAMLHADAHGGVEVALGHRRAWMNAACPAHRLLRGRTSYALLRTLRAAAYARHPALPLDIKNAPAGQGTRRTCLAVQRDYDAMEEEDLLWEAIRAEGGSDDARMLHRAYGAWRNLDSPRQDPPELPRSPQLDGMARRRRGRRRRASQANGGNCQEEEGEGEGEDDPLATPRSYSWAAVMGYPMVQTVPVTCGLVATTVCVEAQHRKEFEAIHGKGTFPCRAAAPRKLRSACFRDRYYDPFADKYIKRSTWLPGKGSDETQVLLKVLELGGVHTTNAPPPAPFLLPIHAFEVHDRIDGFTAEEAARILYRQGPCVGRLFVTAEFFRNEASKNTDTPVVFRGCPREKREEVQDKDKSAGMHGVVCYAYTHTTKGKLIVLVLDNQRSTGPSRWVDFDAFDSFHVIIVKPLPPRHLLDRPETWGYPVSGY